MPQQHSSSVVMTRVIALRKQFRDRQNELMLILGDASHPPRCIQARAQVKDRLVAHGHTLAAVSFPIDPVHFSDVVESMRSVRSPIHLPGAERPNAIRLQAAAEIAGVPYEAGAVVIVEGTHRVAAAWELGWRSIPIRVVSGTLQDVADLAVVSNTKAIKPARSLEDIKNKILLYRDAHGSLPTVPETMAMCRVSKRTVYRCRKEYREELGLPEQAEPTHKDHAVPNLTPAHLAKIRSTLDLVSSSGSEVNCQQAAVMLLAQLLDTDPQRRQLIAEGVNGAVQDVLAPDDNPDF